MTSKYKKIQYTKVTETVNKETGEVSTRKETNVVRIPAEPPYVKMYLEDLSHITGIGSSLAKTLHMLLRKLDYEGCITLSGRFRKACCAELNIKDTTFRNRLVLLCRHKMLIHHDTNEYLVNPDYFARGEWRTIIKQRENFKMTVTYSPSGKRINTSRET